jgi:hypothetical protein
VVAFIIRATMPDLIAHRTDISQLGVPLAQKLSSNATHRCSDPIIAVQTQWNWPQINANERKCFIRVHSRSLAAYMFLLGVE